MANSSSSRTAFRRRLLILLLVLLLILLLALIFAQGLPPPQTRAITVTPSRMIPTPSFSPTSTPLPPELFTVVVTYITRTVILETHTFLPTESPTRTGTPEPGITRTSTPTPQRASCYGHGQDLGDEWLVAGCDNLSFISRWTGVPLEDLLAANAWIADPNLIYPGQVIKLPGRK